MPVTAVVDLQFGDGGKGRLIDALAENADLVVRYNGADNAGHTVVVGGEEYKLHLVPSGILWPGTSCLIADGVAINPRTLAKEVVGLETQGIDTSQLKISGAAQIIMPYHVLRDQVEEDLLGHGAIGTTKRGVGPAYADRAARKGLRVWDLIDEVRLIRSVDRVIPDEQAALEILEQVRQDTEVFRGRVVDGRRLIWQALDKKQNVLFEGAQGAFLDIDQGTYPFVTSSHSTAGGVCLVGIGPHDIDEIIGVTKAYTTRVGNGPFPGKLEGAEGELLRQAGKEFGTTTGRARDCGWFDIPMVRTAVKLNSADCIVITKLDVLDDFETIKVVDSYMCDGVEIDYVPSDTVQYTRCQPVYREFYGWRTSTREARSWDGLPTAARSYVSYLQTALGGIPIKAISVGPERGQIIWLS